MAANGACVGRCCRTVARIGVGRQPRRRASRQAAAHPLSRSPARGLAELALAGALRQTRAHRGRRLVAGRAGVLPCAGAPEPLRQPGAGRVWRRSVEPARRSAAIRQPRSADVAVDRRCGSVRSRRAARVGRRLLWRGYSGVVEGTISAGFAASTACAALRGGRTGTSRWLGDDRAGGKMRGMGRLHHESHDGCPCQRASYHQQLPMG